jgi:hypothetical protein
MNDSTSNRICLFETIRIVISLSICWFRVESFYDHSIEMISFIFIDFRNRREIKEHEDEYAILMRSDQWQRSSKMTWSEEKIFVTNEDLDSQKNLDESWNERLVNEIVKEKFLYNELNFLCRLDKQQLAIHFFRQSIRIRQLWARQALNFSITRSLLLIDWSLFHLFFASFIYLSINLWINTVLKMFLIINSTISKTNLTLKKLDDWNK